MRNQMTDPIDAQFFERYGVRTDLALEAHQVIVDHEGPPEIPGVRVVNEQTDHASISRVSITSDEGARMMGKIRGNYITIESEAFRQHNKEAQEEVAQTVAQEISRFLEHIGLAEDACVLVIGLGNWNATPDSVGPKVVGQLMITRHLYEMSPPELRGGLRPLAAMAPGVLGLTGIETAEIVMGVADRIKPDLVICVDALASRSSERVCSTIQLADSGIHPGSGVGNKRMAISRETLGVPVLAIGVPTVVHAVTIAGDAMELLAQEMGFRPPVGLDDWPPQVSGRLDPRRIRVRETDPSAVEQEGPRHDAFGLPVDPQQKRYMIAQLLQPYMGSMIVTPKDIDAYIDDISTTVAGALNAALHPALDLTEIANYLSRTR
ncbi:MAG: GPR endopeptidase [Firmicutes bacterium]|nr:GPR endopeptidase [Bacillota bacterium]